ncbi:hypothetical protein HG530_001552 [Fusarium avenaceum]|nr:hypothetical protein HG530_001552 [Fusarium avenaceum]
MCLQALASFATSTGIPLLVLTSWSVYAAVCVLDLTDILDAGLRELLLREQTETVRNARRQWTDIGASGSTPDLSRDITDWSKESTLALKLLVLTEVVEGHLQWPMTRESLLTRLCQPTASKVWSSAIGNLASTILDHLDGVDKAGRRIRAGKDRPALLALAHDLHGRDGIAANAQERLVETELFGLEVQHVSPDFVYLGLSLIRKRQSLRIAVDSNWIELSVESLGHVLNPLPCLLAIELPRLKARDELERKPHRRDHVRRQPLSEKCLCLFNLGMCNISEGTVNQLLNNSQESAFAEAFLGKYDHAVLDADAGVDVVLDLAKLNALTMELDLCILAAGDVKGAIMVVSDKITSFVHPPGPVMMWLMIRPSRINDESLACLLGLFVVFPRKRMTFNDKLADGSNGHETVVVVPVNNPTMDTNLATNVQWVLALPHTSMDILGHGFSASDEGLETGDIGGVDEFDKSISIALVVQAADGKRGVEMCPGRALGYQHHSMLPSTQVLNTLIGKNVHLHGRCVIFCAVASRFCDWHVLTLEPETHMIKTSETFQEDGPCDVENVALSLMGKRKIAVDSVVFQTSRNIRCQTLILLARFRRWEDRWLHGCH